MGAAGHHKFHLERVPRSRELGCFTRLKGLHGVDQRIIETPVMREIPMTVGNQGPQTEWEAVLNWVKLGRDIECIMNGYWSLPTDARHGGGRQGNFRARTSH